MSGDIIVGLVAVTASLFLTVRALRGRGVSFEKNAAMAAAWIAIIAVLAFVISRFAA